MSGSTSNLSVDKQQASVAAKRKEEDAAAVAQAAVATAHREQEALVNVVPAAHKTLDEARARQRATALAWEKEEAIARHMEKKLVVAHGIAIPQDDDEDRSVDAGSNLDAALTTHLHAQAAGLQNI
jgi:mannose-1-phosphate guanylyltransferase